MSNAWGWQCLPGLQEQKLFPPLQWAGGGSWGMVPPPHFSISLLIKWGHGAGIDFSAAFLKCLRFFPVTLSVWWSSPRLSSRFLPKLGSHNAYVCVRKQWSSFHIIPLPNTHISSGKIWNTSLDPSVLMLPDCLQCETNSGFQVSLWSSLNLCLVCCSRSNPDCPVAFLNMPATTAMHEGQVNPGLNDQTSAWVRQPCSPWGGCVVRALCGLLRNCKNNIKKSKLKCLHFREIWPYGFDWSFISSFKSSDQIIELINDFPWFYMCWHELSLSAAY